MIGCKLTTQVPLWANSVQNHVAGNLPSNVAHEENRDQSVVLRAFEAQVLLQRVQLGIDKRIAVEEVEEVHDPEHGLGRRC